MAVSSFDLNVSYGQLAIFWSTLPQPFNDWTDQHVGQGFAWRPGSASFRTLIESGIHTVDVNLVDQALPVSSDAVRVIEVPFDVPADGAIEVASISDSVPLTLPAGMYQLLAFT